MARKTKKSNIYQGLTSAEKKIAQASFFAAKRRKALRRFGPAFSQARVQERLNILKRTLASEQRKRRSNKDISRLYKPGIRYASSLASERVARLGSGIQKVGAIITAGGGGDISQVFGSTRRSVGHRGRPTGASGKYILPDGTPVGVYEYRKFMAHERYLERINAERNAQLTPEQQQALRDLQLRRNAERINPEQQIIPDTTGIIPLNHLHKEAEDAANLVP